MMEKNGMVKRLWAVILLVIAVIGLNMQGTSAFAETLSPERQGETLEEGESDEQAGNEETELSVDQTDASEEQSVSGNDISAEVTDERNETIAAPIDEGAGDTNNTLNDEILKKCIVNGMNPPGVTVNLFDYSQDNIPKEELDKGIKEVAHDYYYIWSGGSGDNKEPIVGTDPHVNTYNLGISKNHLLRFGYRGNEAHDYCRTIAEDGRQLGDYGDWNEYHTVRWPGIVQNRLYNGYPRLNLSNKDYGRYADGENSSIYLKDENKTESLAYLFEPYSTGYKTSYRGVQGLFQRGADGYYYYNSQENFASFDINTNSFTLYNSPGVAKEKDDKPDEAKFCGQFFPFNTAYDVFDSYIKNDDGKYHLTYTDIGKQGDKNSDYAPITDGGNNYIKCYAPKLNHYLGLTLEMSFVQPVGGHVNGGTGQSDEMIFKFSGDDDVWIFIDDVLVADLGGLHDALVLSINFASGKVNVEGVERTLYDIFVSEYGADLGGVRFNGNTFADNTVHTLKMFYLERGHMASNLSLSFNIQPLSSPPSYNEEKDVTDENTSDSYVVVNVPVEISVSDNTLYDNTEIPKTGDDSMIGWWAALCIISLVGIGATVCNLIIRKRKHDK